MKIMFKSFGSFDGVSRTYVAMKNTKVGKRCAEFKPASKVGKFPACFPGLVDGGRSPGLVRPKHPHGCKARSGKPAAAKKSSKRKSRKARR